MALPATGSSRARVWLIAPFVVYLLCVLGPSSLKAGEELDRIGFSELRTRADAGDSKAQWHLAFEYHLGHDLPKDESQATYWWTKASSGLRKLAEAGDATAQCLLGRAYREGWGVSRDPLEAQKWLESAAEQDDILALGVISSGLWQRFPTGSPERLSLDRKLVEAYRKGAEGGNSNAMIRFAGVLTDGRGGVAKNEQEALKWLRKAGELGNVKAQIALGGLYAYRNAGIIVPTIMSVQEDKTEGLRWYKLAAAFYLEEARDGNPQAQYNYGAILEKCGKIWSRGPRTLRYSSELSDAAFWWLKAAYQGDNQAQRSLGQAYTFGQGMEPNEVEGFAWDIVSAAGAPEYLKENAEDQVRHSEVFYGPEKTRMARQRSMEILAEIKLPPTGMVPADETADGSKDAPTSSGTGAIISAQGHVLTAAHVVKSAKRIAVISSTGMHKAIVLRVDESNDVAVLKIEDGTYKPFPIAPSLRVRLGQAVSTIGFPNVEIQGFSPKVTRGEISSLNGAGDDPRCWQISAPVQPGNSGGPLIDERGNLIGIVVSKLGLRAAKITGDVPQNVNYAVKSAYAVPLLEPYLNGDAPEPIGAASKPGFEDMVANAQQSVVLVLVY